VADKSNGGGSVTPIKFAPLLKLACSETVRINLENGDPPEEVAGYIQDEKGLLEDMPRHQLVMLLADYAEHLLAEARASASPELSLPHPLPPPVPQIDEQGALADLLAIQMERIRWMKDLEQSLRFPMKAMPAEITAATRIIKTAGQLRALLKDAGETDEVAERRLGRLREEHDGIAALIDNPRLRQRLLGIIERTRAQERLLTDGDDD
jgi:hypothetical protein